MEGGKGRERKKKKRERKGRRERGGSSTNRVCGQETVQCPVPYRCPLNPKVQVSGQGFNIHTYIQNIHMQQVVYAYMYMHDHTTGPYL